MYVKLQNKNTSKTFVVSQKSADHYSGDTNILYLGQCDVNGNITVSAEDDIAWKAKTFQEQVNIVADNVKKKTVATALHRGDPDREEHGIGETADTYDVDDED